MSVFLYLLATTLIKAHNHTTCVSWATNHHIIQRCMDTYNHNSNKGFYKLKNHNKPYHKGLILHGRLSGLVVQEFNIINEGEYKILHFHVPCNYSYSAFASVLYSNHTFSNKSRTLINAVIFTDEFFIPTCGIPIQNRHTTLCRIEDLNTRHFTNGYWLLPNASYLPAFSYLQDMQPYVSNQLMNSTFHIHGCQLDRQINNKLKICFFGDSQMRHLAYDMDQLYSGLPPQTVTSGETEKSNIVRYWWGYDNTVIPQCDVFAINFGQWQLSWATDGKPWPVEKYAAAVETLLNGTHPIIRNRLLWLTVNPIGMSRSLNSSKSMEFRSSYNLHMYARASIAVAKKLRVHYLDVFTIANSLRDVSYDGAHFKGCVGREIAVLVHNKALQIFNTSHLRQSTTDTLSTNKKAK